MEQIYYTQCPMGYGLGASNGFQVKRITPGYPLSGDFRHLGLRAFPAGSRTLAPRSLRYRRVDDRAEVAALTPRVMEYETERGLWGRPGGHFAHGLILDAGELNSIDDWPAGLFDAETWRRTDPEPTRGRVPDPLMLSRDGMPVAPTFGEVVSLAAGLEGDMLARLLTALALATREGRTLFLIDEPDRLGRRVAFMTFLLPPPLRSALTFSTYHDRPEELPGYRIHGTTAAARPNRGLLLTQGVVADLTTGTVEPRVDPASWSREVARWVAEGSASEWDEFARRLATAGVSEPDPRWDDAWLDRLVAFGRAIRRGSATDWTEEADLTRWATGSSLAGEWSAARSPEWWEEAEVGEGEGRTALVLLAGWPTTWRDRREEAWGRVVARWFAEATADEREAAAVAFARGAPTNPARFAFVQALRSARPAGLWEGVRRRLDASFRTDPRMVALWAVPEAVASAIAGKVEPLRALGRRFESLGEPAESLLDAARVEAGGRLKWVERLGEALADRFESPDAFHWALDQGERAADWLRPYFRRRLALPDDRDGWRALTAATPAALRPNLARTVLAVASEPTLPDDAFPWGVEEILLTIPEPDRPADTSWPGRYLDRSGSDLALIGLLFGRGTRSPALRGWIDAARTRGDLTPAHLDRLMHLRNLAKSLDPREPAPLEFLDLARIPGRDRGPLLARLLRRDAVASSDAGATLDRCGLAWSSSLDPRSPDLPALARAVAESDLMAASADDPASWFHRLAEIRRRLQPATPPSAGFGPDGLVARVVAARVRGEGPTRRVWDLRAHVLNDEAGWRSIAEDLRLDLLDDEPDAAPEVVDRWDRAVRKERPGRFWEAALNASDGRRLAAVVAARASDLASLEPLSWWDCASHPDARDDLRDAFARLAPLAPIDEDALNAVQNWMDRPRAAEPPARGARPWLSSVALARWTCIDRLSKDIYRDGITDQTRRFSLLDWTVKLSLADVPLDDRYRLISWVVFKIADPSAYDIPRLGHWLVRSALTDLDRIAAWPCELAGLADVPEALARDRAEVVRDLRQEMARVIADSRG